MHGISRRFVHVFGCALLVLAACGLCVCAAEIGEDSPPPPSDTFPPDGLTVVLDPGSVSDIVEGIADVLATEPPEDTEPVEQTDPAPYEVVLTPDAVDGLAAAIADAMATEDAPEAASPWSLSADFNAGYYFDANCVLGNNLRFYIPADCAVDCISISDPKDGSFEVVNLSNSRIYAYCPSNPSLTIYADRFGQFVYSDRTQVRALNITSIQDSNISFLRDAPQAIPPQRLFLIAIVVLILFGLVRTFVVRR